MIKMIAATIGPSKKDTNTGDHFPPAAARPKQAAINNPDNP